VTLAAGLDRNAAVAQLHRSTARSVGEVLRATAETRGYDTSNTAASRYGREGDTGRLLEIGRESAQNRRRRQRTQCHLIAGGYLVFNAGRVDWASRPIEARQPSSKLTNPAKPEALKPSARRRSAICAVYPISFRLRLRVQQFRSLRTGLFV
jgi:hypothetical protein